jgi:hypothetical protein
VKDKKLSKRAAQQRIRRQWRCFLEFKTWLEEVAPLYPKFKHLVAGGYRFLHITGGVEKFLNSHIHSVMALYTRIPQVLLSKYWGAVSGGPIVDMQPLYGTPEKIAWYVGEKESEEEEAERRKRKALKKGRQKKREKAFFKKFEEGMAIPQAGRLVIDAYLNRRHRRQGFGIEKKEMQRSIAAVEAAARAERVCPHCGRTGCETGWFGKIKDGPIAIVEGQRFKCIIGYDLTHLPMSPLYELLAPFRIVDDSGICESPWFPRGPP